MQDYEIKAELALLGISDDQIGDLVEAAADYGQVQFESPATKRNYFLQFDDESEELFLIEAG